MELIKLVGKDAELMTAAARALEKSKEANELQKDAEAAKELIARELLNLRKLNLDLLPAKTIVVVQCDGQDTIKIEIKESKRFDSKAFRLLHLQLSEEFTRPSPAKWFDSLLPTSK
jgi:hypothetical protein